MPKTGWAPFEALQFHEARFAAPLRCRQARIRFSSPTPFSPCAIGAIINDNTIKKIKCKIIAGAANNVLEDYNKHGKILLDRDILYAPDYVINAGGLINIYNELNDYKREKVYNQVETIYDTLMDIFHQSENNQIATNTISDMIAQKIINQKSKAKALSL